MRALRWRARSPPSPPGASGSAVAAANVIRSMTIAISAITMPTRRLSPKRALRMVSSTSHPMSAVPPMMEAMITIENAAMVVWLTPRRICRRALGARIRQKSCLGVAPAISPASMTSGDTRESPSTVLRTVGGKA